MTKIGLCEIRESSNFPSLGEPRDKLFTTALRTMPARGPQCCYW